LKFLSLIVLSGNRGFGMTTASAFARSPKMGWIIP